MVLLTIIASASNVFMRLEPYKFADTFCQEKMPVHKTFRLEISTIRLVMYLR